MVKRKLFRTPLIKLHGFVIKPWQSCLRTCFSCIRALWLWKYSMARFMVMCVDFIPSHGLLLLNCYTGQLFKADVGGDTEKPLSQRLWSSEPVNWLNETAKNFNFLWSQAQIMTKFLQLQCTDYMSIFHTCFKELLKISMKQVLTNYW